MQLLAISVNPPPYESNMSKDMESNKNVIDNEESEGNKKGDNTDPKVTNGSDGMMGGSNMGVDCSVAQFKEYYHI